MPLETKERPPTWNWTVADTASTVSVWHEASVFAILCGRGLSSSSSCPLGCLLVGVLVVEEVDGGEDMVELVQAKRAPVGCLWPNGREG